MSEPLVSDIGDLARISPSALRKACREGAYQGLTSGLARGYLQGNLVILPASAADEFEAFCRANDSPLPLLERGRVDDPFMTSGVDCAIPTDLPQYRS